MVVIACVLVFVVFRGDIFGAEGSSANAPSTGQKFDLSEKSTPAAIMTALMTNAGSPETVEATFDLQIDIEADTSGLSPEEAQMIDKPWTLSGTLGADKGVQGADVDMSLGMMGSNMNVALRVLDGAMWIGLSDQWYEAPSDSGLELPTSTEGGVRESLSQMQDLLLRLSIDPMSWLGNQATVKEEKLDGAKVLHISGSDPDWAVMVGDLAKLMLSPEFQSMMDSSGTGGSSLQDQLPSADELLRLGSQLDEIFQKVQVDLWVDKESALLRKATIVCDVVPPTEDLSGMDDSALGSFDLSGSGITRLSLNATITVDPFADVSIKAPSDVRSSDQMMADVEADPSLLGPLGQLLMGMGAGY